ncbi:MAG: hypothetical protein ACREJC_17630 [Tepidisphaeraceae bacterium]
MIITAKFTGKNFVPDEPVKLPRGEQVVLNVMRGVKLLGPKGGSSAAKILKSGAVGSWAHRKDIKNSAEFARRLRRQAERRGGR